MAHRIRFQSSSLTSSMVGGGANCRPCLEPISHVERWSGREHEFGGGVADKAGKPPGSTRRHQGLRRGDVDAL